MKYVAYYRVSTKKQGESGLGLKAQRKAVLNFIAPELIDAEFEEVETGTNKKYRPVLKQAIELCKENDATLIIAKLDRLARNVAFVSALMNSGIKFKAVDMPKADELSIHIMSAIAENEAKVISKRIKDALAIKKEQLAKEGKKLGNPNNLTDEHRRKGTEILIEKRKTNPNNKRALAFLKQMDTSNKTYEEIAKILNDNDFRTSRGKKFQGTQVWRLLKSLS
jgi:DNA invertase Pin-like site-specific DNA recombinase